MEKQELPKEEMQDTYNEDEEIVKETEEKGDEE